MGTYIAIGVVTQIEVSRQSFEFEKLAISDIQKTLANNYDLLFFQQDSEDTNTLIWRLRPEVMTLLPDFLERQYALFPTYGYRQDDTREIITTLRACPDTEPRTCRSWISKRNSTTTS